MKKKSLFAALSLIATLGLASCSYRSNSSTGTSSAAASSASSVASSSAAVSSVSESSSALANDPYSAVIPGLDLTAGTNAAADSAANGYSDAAGSTAFGWVEYTAYGSKYGCAVKITFADGKAVAIVIGVPEDGAHNFTPMYAADKGASEYATYVKSLQTNVEAAIVGKSALELANALKDVKVNDSGTFTPADGYKFVGTGATQTDSRTDMAIYQACLAYTATHSLQFDPFSTVFSAISNPTSPTTGTVTGQGIYASAENALYGWALYNSWSSDYGAALKLTIDTSSKVTAVALGLPKAGAHNYTPKYIIKGGIATFYTYCTTVKSALETALIGKSISELATAYASCAIDLTGSTFTPATRFVGTGATQTDTRLGIAVEGACQAYVS
jgi:hypothetical protein